MEAQKKIGRRPVSGNKSLKGSGRRVMATMYEVKADLKEAFLRVGEEGRRDISS